MKLEGSISEIRFRNEENQYTIARLETEDGDIVVVGILPALQEGDHVEITGELIFHPKFGEQIQVQGVRYLPPATPDAIITYLSSGVLPGIGPVTAKRIVGAFGKDTLKIMEKSPRRLLEVPGIGEKTLEKILSGMENQRGVRDLLIYMQNLGITLNQSYRIIKVYGEDAPRVLSQNPYRLIQDIPGIGFRTADEIALKNKVERDSLFRVEAGLRHCLKEAEQQEGHCYLPLEMLLEETVKLLDLPGQLIRDVLFQMILRKDLFLKNYGNLQAVYSMPMYRAENNVAGRLANRMLKAKTEPASHLKEQIEDYELREQITLGDNQKKALEAAMTYPLLVITGGPGTGKTTILKGILDLMEKEGQKIVLCAPTGRAAKRMEESTGHEAATIHRLLGYRPGEAELFEYNEENPLLADVIIVDEASMMDIYLMNVLTGAMHEDTKMIFVGDVDQLPSVGPGNVLADLIDSGCIPTIRLYEIYRQGQDSDIVMNAHRINRGLRPFLNRKGKDFFMMRSTQKETVKLLGDLMSRRLPETYHVDPFKEIQILTPVKRGETGVHQLNKAMQEVLNPPKPGRPELRHYGIIYRQGDKVMQMKNDYQAEWDAHGEKGTGIFNGELGMITAIDKSNEVLWVEFDDERLVRMEKKDLDGLALAYATTIHKAQGSEFPIILIPLHQWTPMLYTRNLIYTAITRAEKLVILLGEDRVLYRTIENNRIDRRFSGLSWQIAHMMRQLKEVHRVGLDL